MAAQGEDKTTETAQGDDGRMFEAIVAFFIEPGVSQVRLQVWKKKVLSTGGKIEDRLSRRLTHIFASSLGYLMHRIDSVRLKKLKKLQVKILKYEWLEDSLKAGHVLPTEKYDLVVEGGSSSDESGGSGNESLGSDVDGDGVGDGGGTDGEPPKVLPIKQVGGAELAGYVPPNLNKEITAPFEELKNIYKDALGDGRRSFSYYKAISTLEKLPFKIRSVDQVKKLPTIGKSMKDHVHEILTTGKLAKLEHFKEDEKVKTLILFGAIWGVGPSVALRLYEKGNRTLEDLEREPSLTRPQRIGLKFYEDIKKKIPREDAKHMEKLVQDVAKAIDPQISVICGGSYRRGKALVGDMDMVVTHPDGVSHRGFLEKLVSKLKDIDFLTEDLVVAYHEDEDEVDTYFGLCKYPGREQRHRIDFKVYSARQYPFGLVAWTGNDVLNRSLRIAADKLGFKLDDKGLYRRTQHNGTKKPKVENKHWSVPCKTERDVFDFVQYPWLEPYQRNL